MGVKDIDKGYKKIIQSLGKVNKSFTKVGVMESASYPDGTPVAQVAFNNEYGTTTIPSRPFMRQAYKLNESELKEVINTEFKNLIDGKVSESQALSRIGAFFQGKIQSEISVGNFAPNAASTIRLKGSSSPLIDTGVLRTSITHEEIL